MKLSLLSKPNHFVNNTKYIKARVHVSSRDPRHSEILIRPTKQDNQKTFKTWRTVTSLKYNKNYTSYINIHREQIVVFRNINQFIIPIHLLSLHTESICIIFYAHVRLYMI